MALMIILIPLCVHLLLYLDLLLGISGVRISSPKFQDCFWKPPNLLQNGYRVFFPRVKRPGFRVKNSPPVSAELKNKWLYTFTPPICLHDVDRENFTFV